MQTHVANNGRTARWEAAALQWIVEQLEATKRFADVDWNARSVVEVKAAGADTPWFLHAQTGDEWLLRLKFRVRRNAFRQAELAAELGLKSVDDLDELPIYGRGERVTVRNIRGPWQEVTITVHWLKEIDTPAMRRFLDAAVESYFQKLEEMNAGTRAVLPWQVLGMKWHLTRKGFPGDRPPAWQPDVVTRLDEAVRAAAPWLLCDPAHRQRIEYRTSDRTTVVTIETKRTTAVYLDVWGMPAAAGDARLANLPGAPKRSVKGGRERIRFTLRTADDVNDALRDWLAEQLRSQHPPTAAAG
ncbi:MAG: hypothetical protein D6725_04065 [Planctomycetota bacterium]|nr:MAG: hypothetical protein D6725_04065 [Planctomycetota bacterium]